MLGLTLAAHGFNKFFGGGEDTRAPRAGLEKRFGMKYGTVQAVVAATNGDQRGPGLGCRPADAHPRRRHHHRDAGRGVDRASAQRLLHRQGGLGVQLELWRPRAVVVATLRPWQYSLDYQIFGPYLLPPRAGTGLFGSVLLGIGGAFGQLAAVLPAAGQAGSVAAADSPASTSFGSTLPRADGAVRPIRTSTAELSVPAQWMRPHGGGSSACAELGEHTRRARG